eukprot:7105540-Heterocapsa_arctica.AAC.1
MSSKRQIRHRPRQYYVLLCLERGQPSPISHLCGVVRVARMSQKRLQSICSNCPPSRVVHRTSQVTDRKERFCPMDRNVVSCKVVSSPRRKHWQGIGNTDQQRDHDA